jgi:hypothetical protein
MPEVEIPLQDDLRGECRVFVRYLTGREAAAYVVDAYCRLHPAVLRDAPAALPIDSALTRIARTGPVRARVADAYARFFRPRCMLRRKLILAFSILENSHDSHRSFTSGGNDSLWSAVLRILTSLATFSLALAAGVAIFAPRQLLGLMRAPEHSE